MGSWLSGPRSFAEAAGVDLGHPGKRLGLPESGVNSVAGFGRRLSATFIDWMSAVLIVSAWGLDPDARAAATLAVFAVINLALVATVGAGLGGRLLGVRVARLDGTNPPPVSVALRTFLMALVIPALIWDRDGRSIHDRLAHTVVVRR